MAGIFVALAVIFYFAFLIDWKEFRGVLGQGGWAALAFYGLVGVAIYIAVSGGGPAASGMH